MTEVITATVAGFAAGWIDSIAGGGGLISLPTLLSFGMPPHVALGTNKAQAVVGALASVFTFCRARAVPSQHFGRMIFSGLLGGAIGASLVLWLDPHALKPLMLGLMIFASIFMVFRSYISRGLIRRFGRLPIRGVLAATGLVLGTYDGFFGPGTGSLMIVCLATLGGLSLVSASAHGKVMNTASAVASVSVFLVRKQVDWHFAFPMMAANLIGQTLGSRMAIRRGDSLIRALVFCVLACLIIKLIYAQWG